MNKLTKTILAAVCAFPVMAYAADLSWLTFRMADHTELSVSAEDLSIDYSEGNLKLHSATVDQIIPTENIISMRFSAVPSSTGQLGTEESLQADYYTLDGKKVGSFASPDDARSALQSGIYLGKSTGKTFKIIF